MCIAWYIIYLCNYLDRCHVVVHVLLVNPLSQGDALSLSQVPWPPECPHPWPQHSASRHPLQPTNDSQNAMLQQMHDNATVLPFLLFPVLPCVRVCPPVCLENPDCLTLVHTVRPSDAHRAYLHESDISRTPDSVPYYIMAKKRAFVISSYSPNSLHNGIGKWPAFNTLCGIPFLINYTGQ